MPSDEDDVHETEVAEVDDGDGDGGDEAASALPASLSGLLSQLEAVSEQLEVAVEDVSEVIVEGSSAGRSVVIQLTGGMEAVSVRIDPALVDPTDVSMLEDAVLAALRDGLVQVAELQAELADEIESEEVDLSSILGQLGGLVNFGGLGLPDLGSLAAGGNPEDLIAGLTGALGNMPGGLGASFPGGLSDIMAGLGLGGAAAPSPTAAGSEDERDDEGIDSGSPAVTIEAPTRDDDDRPTGS